MASIVLGYVVYLFRWRMWAAAVVIIASTFSVDLPGEYYAGPLAVGSVAAATNGETAYNYAVQAVGATYVWGAPTRDAAHMGSMSQPSFDCSGLIWEVATMMASVVPDLAANPPATSQAWWFYGHSIVGTPWDNNLPTGALLFLHDDNPALGGGATHVSIYGGGGVAMDCYNTSFGCNTHNVATDQYYHDHWLGATYPWGDAGGTATTPPPITAHGVGSGELVQTLQNPGPMYNTYASPIAAWSGEFGQVGSVMGAQVSGKDGGALARQQSSGFAQLVGNGRGLDQFFPLHLELALAVVCLVLLIRVAMSIIRWLIGLSPL